MKNILLGIAVLGSFGLLACSSSDSETVKESSSSASTGVSAIEGSFEIDGSSTVYPVAEAVAEEFGKHTSEIHGIEYSKETLTKFMLNK